MKVRTITTGISLSSLKEQERIIQATQFNQTAKAFLEQQEYEVQTTRITTNSWGDYLQFSTREIVSEIQAIEALCQNLNVSFFSAGYVSSPEKIAIIPEIIKNSSIVYCSSKIGDSETGINFANVSESAKVIKRIAEETADGYGNFRFCAWANCKPGIPFFPVSYHEGEPAFAIGLECSDLVTKAFTISNSLQTAEEKLKLAFEEELTKIEAIAKQISDKFGIKYSGIDSSLAPSLDRETSIAFAYEKLGFGKFGHQGTLTISAIITRVLKSLSIKTCGYSGLMLPVCEDVGLAQRANEQTYNLTNLLLYSAVWVVSQK